MREHIEGKRVKREHAIEKLILIGTVQPWNWGGEGGSCHLVSKKK